MPPPKNKIKTVMEEFDYLKKLLDFLLEEVGAILPRRDPERARGGETAAKSE